MNHDYAHCADFEDDFLGWLFAKGNDHDIWTVPEEEENDPNKTI